MAAGVVWYSFRLAVTTDYAWTINTEVLEDGEWRRKTIDTNGLHAGKITVEVREDGGWRRETIAIDDFAGKIMADVWEDGEWRQKTITGDDFAGKIMARPGLAGSGGK